jgi:cytochrome c oxidase cbb3-type subunit 3
MITSARGQAFYPSIVVHDRQGPYAENAYGISQGQRLFEQFNCSGCHSHGGGGMGPPLMDRDWRYGSDAANIFATIVEGRPGGMPAFRGKLTTDQVWMLVAYVQTMSGRGRKDVRTGRRDNMQMRSSEQNTQTPPPTGTP